MASDITPEIEHKAVDRIKEIHWAVRAACWSAVILTALFTGVAFWSGLVRRDPFALFYVLLAGLFAVAGTAH